MFNHLNWAFNGFDKVAGFDRSVTTRYPIRYLRYWFPRMVLENLYENLTRPLSVLEVGIGGGQMLGFVGGSIERDRKRSLPPWIERWDGVDVKLEQGVLDRFAYSDYVEADVERAFDLKGRRYHAIVLIHLLEHLFDPESAMCRLSNFLHEDGVIIGGSPTMPEFLACAHEPWLRRKNRGLLEDVLAHRHLSVITPGRIRRFARRNDFSLELLAGAFLCRWSGLFLENHEGWVRANLLWGALFPALGGEIYFCLRRKK